MVKSNLKLFSNIYHWKGRWKEGDQEFVAKIWDDKALAILKIAARKKELTLTDYQDRLYETTIQCPLLPKGERPWGWVAAGRTACLCRKESCPKFLNCRAENGELSKREKELWSSGEQEGLADFRKVWEENCCHIEQKRDIGEVKMIDVLGNDEYDAVKSQAERPFDPKIASGYPDDEEFE